MLPFDAAQVLRGGLRPAAALIAARSAARTFAEQINLPNNPLALELQRAWWRAVSEKFPNDGTICGKAGPTGDPCRNQTSTSVSSITCGQHKTSAAPVHSPGGVRGYCAVNCGRRLQQSSLCCGTCSRGICHVCVEDDLNRECPEHDGGVRRAGARCPSPLPTKEV